MQRKRDYEALNRFQKFCRLLRVALLTLIICLAIIAPLLWYWDASIEMRLALRNAKNVLQNTELLAIEYNGEKTPLLDSARESGLSKKAEEEIKDYSAADGKIQLVGWDFAKGRVLSMTYQEGRFLLIYQWDPKTKAGEWTIYRKARQYQIS